MSYLQEIRLGDVDVIRALFERAISLSLAPKKMKVCTNYIYSAKEKKLYKLFIVVSSLK